MAQGLPDSPYDDLDFSLESMDDETCPSCGHDITQYMLDVQAAYNNGILAAIGQEGVAYTAMSTQAYAYYWRCPECKTCFSSETEESFHGMGA